MMDWARNTWFDSSLDVFDPTELQKSTELVIRHFDSVVDDGFIGHYITQLDRF